jgi:serine-type D-Ala-D-Ala carboxypeptidase/endopeptidase (penicillin-binding protein 4)
MPPALFDAPTLRGAQVSAYVIDASSGAVLYSRNADDAMMPASTLKLVVGSASLDELGTGFSFATTLATDGTTLYLRGTGDPLLLDGDFGDAVRALTSLGQTHFVALAGDASAVDAPAYPDGWALDDLVYDYGAPPSALSIDENSLRVHLQPGAPGAPLTLTTDPATSAVAIVNDAVTGPPHSDDTTDLRVDWGSPYALKLTGSLPADDKDADFGIAMLDPGMVTLALVQDALTKGGVRFDGADRMGATPNGARVLWTHRSQALPELLKSMWLPSNNLLAESLLDAIGQSATSASGNTRERGLATERAWLQAIGIDPRTTTIVDGSGLSAYDRITAHDLVKILTHDWNGSNRGTVLAALPVGGRSGTLKSRFTSPPLAGHVIAKTGTVNHTRTLAGFLQTPHGTLIFALMVNDWMDPSPQAAENLHAFQSTFLESFFE